MKLELRVEDETPADVIEKLANGIPSIMPAIDSVRIIITSSERKRQYHFQEAEATLDALLSEAAKDAEMLDGEPALVAADNIGVVKVNKRLHLILNSPILYQNIGREIVGFSQTAKNNELMLRVTHKPFFYAGCWNHSRPGIYLQGFGTDKWQTDAGQSFPRYQSAIAAFAKNYDKPLWLASHELGHNFGLRHHTGVGSQRPECIMSFNANKYCDPCKDRIMERKSAR